MAYNRSPNVVIAGLGLKQTPTPETTAPPGVVPVVLDANIASGTELGVVQVGSGLSISNLGILSADCSGSGLVNVKITLVNYTASNTDYFIVAASGRINITLPLGITGKVYVIKNQAHGSVTVKTTDEQEIDNDESVTLGSNNSLIVIFDGTKWNVID